MKSASAQVARTLGPEGTSSASGQQGWSQVPACTAVRWRRESSGSSSKHVLWLARGSQLQMVHASSGRPGHLLAGIHLRACHPSFTCISNRALSGAGQSAALACMQLRSPCKLQVVTLRSTPAEPALKGDHYEAPGVCMTVDMCGSSSLALLSRGLPHARD